MSEQKKTTQSVKLVLVGDGTVGKTCLCYRFSVDDFIDNYIPTIMDTYEMEVTVGGTPVTVSVNDTAGQEEYDRLRPLIYPYTDVFLILFSLDSYPSFWNVGKKWIPEIKHYCKNTPFLLIGSKKDLRQWSTSDVLVKKHEGENLAKETKAYKYFECSAKTKEGVQEVFRAAILAAVASKQRPKQRKRQKTCSIT